MSSGSFIGHVKYATVQENWINANQINPYNYAAYWYLKIKTNHIAVTKTWSKSLTTCWTGKGIAISSKEFVELLNLSFARWWWLLLANRNISPSSTTSTSIFYILMTHINRVKLRKILIMNENLANYCHKYLPPTDSSYK